MNEFDRYGLPFFSLWAPAIGPAIYSWMVLFVLTFLGLTVWKKHVERPDLMGRSLLMNVVVFILPPLSVVGYLVLTAAGLMNADTVESGILGLISILMLAVTWMFLMASLVYFALAILPPRTRGQKSQNRSSQAVPEKEPWAD